MSARDDVPPDAPGAGEPRRLLDGDGDGRAHGRCSSSAAPSRTARRPAASSASSSGSVTCRGGARRSCCGSRWRRACCAAARRSCAPRWAAGPTGWRARTTAWSARARPPRRRPVRASRGTRRRRASAAEPVSGRFRGLRFRSNRSPRRARPARCRSLVRRALSRPRPPARTRPPSRRRCARCASSTIRSARAASSRGTSPSTRAATSLRRRWPSRFEAALAHHDVDVVALANRYLRLYPHGSFAALARQALASQ